MVIMETTTHSPSSPAQRNGIPPAERIRIVSTPGVCGGRPRIDGHRITVEDVAIWSERLGMSPDEIVSAYPSITLSDVHAALAYYFEHRGWIDAAIQDGARFVAEMRARAGPSLVQEKLGRRKADASDDPISSR
jgi:uncharacterized protein (DUF433 family)